jgi:hypothetical protein
MTRSWPRHLLLSLAFLASGSLLFPGKPPPAHRIVPGPYVKKAPAPAGRPGPSRFFLEGLTVLVEYLEPPERARFIESIDADMGDPFGVAPGRPQRYHAFRVTFQNQSPGDVVFQAGNVLLITDRKERQFPIDLADMYFVASRRGVSDPEAVINRIAPLIFDSSTQIRSGKSLSRLLIFGQLPEKWKEFRLHFSFIQIDRETHTLSFTFHKRFLES